MFQHTFLQGPSVVGAINAFKPSERGTNRPFRLPISDVFKGQRGGLSVGGKLEGGAVKVGAPVRVMPSNEVATVRSIEVDGAPATLARAGDSADLTLAGKKCSPHSCHELSDCIDKRDHESMQSCASTSNLSWVGHQQHTSLQMPSSSRSGKHELIVHASSTI